MKWAVLGCSNFARRRTIPALLNTPSADLVGIASRSIEKAESFCKEFNLRRPYGTYESMLADPEIDAVYNPLPNGLHAQWMMRAADSGKHTLSEKPFASDAAEAQRVADYVRGKDVLVMEGFMWRFHSQHIRARKAIDEGVIGAVRLVRGAFTFMLPRMENVRLVADLAGGSVMDIGCYPISGARYYFGAEPTAVYAKGDIDPQYRVDMRVSGVLEFPQGRALFDCGFDLPFRGHLEIVGDAGIIEFDRPWLPNEEATWSLNEKIETLPAENQYVNQFEDFSQSILERKSPRYGPEDAVRQMRVIDAVLRSVKSGRTEMI